MKHVYCILNSAQKIKLSGGGLYGLDLYNISCREISAVVSDVSTLDYKEENLLLHAEIIEKLMRFGTVLPFRFGIAFNDEQTVRGVLESFYESFSDNLKRLEGRVEMGIKIIWQPEKIIERATGIKPRWSWPDPAVSSTGTGYLKRKMEEHFARSALESGADQLVREIDGIFRPLFEECRVQTLRTRNMPMNGVYLIARGRLDEFRRRFRHLKEQYPDLRFLLTGPWPPYNFTGINSSLNQTACPLARDGRENNDCR